MNGLLNGIVNGFMFWFLIIILIVTGCIVFHFFATIALVVIVWYFCKFWFTLFILTSSRERLALIIATAIFMSFVVKNPENLPLWLGGTVVLGLIGLKKAN